MNTIYGEQFTLQLNNVNRHKRTVAFLPLHSESSTPPQQDAHWQKPYEELTVMRKWLGTSLISLGDQSKMKAVYKNIWLNDQVCH